MTTDALLQAARRVDWRFLLPDPHLKRVAFIGSETMDSSARAALVDALRLFSASLTCVDQRHQATSAPHDTVVVIDPTLLELERAVEWLRPGGWLYAETRRRSPLFRRSIRYARAGCRPSAGARAFARTLQQLGLDEVEAYWHYPDFESCSEIVPLGDRAALLYALTRHQSGGSARLKSRLGRWAVQIDLFPWLIPCFSLVACRKATGGG